MFGLLNRSNGESGTIILGDDVHLPETFRELADTMDVTRRIFAIRQIEKQIEQLKVQDEESRRFYAERMRKCDERIDAFKREILTFLQLHDMRSIQTPAGTAYKKLLTTKQWPSDDALVTWCGSYLPDAIRTKHEPEKRLISAHIRATGEIPAGYTETQETRLYIR